MYICSKTQVQEMGLTKRELFAALNQSGDATEKVNTNARR